MFSDNVTFWIYTNDGRKVGEFQVGKTLFSPENEWPRIEATLNIAHWNTCRDLGLDYKQHNYCIAAA